MWHRCLATLQVNCCRSTWLNSAVSANLRKQASMYPPYPEKRSSLLYSELLATTFSMVKSCRYRKALKHVTLYTHCAFSISLSINFLHKIMLSYKQANTRHIQGYKGILLVVKMLTDTLKFKNLESMINQ